MSAEVRDAYSRRAAEYADRLGSVEAVHPADRLLVDGWADRLAGPVIDAGCGPGHWTAHLATRLPTVRGVDLVPAFIDRARATRPGVRFDVGDLGELDEATDSVGGVLAWYSLIHHGPEAIRGPLQEFARILRPGGSLLLGFFEGPALERFEHAIAPAYRWPVEELRGELERAGFDVVETHTRTGPGYRPHGAIEARRSGA